MKLAYVTTACVNEIARIVNNVSVIISAISLLLSTLWAMAVQVISNIRANKRFLSRSASTSFCSLLKIIFCVFITPYFFSLPFLANILNSVLVVLAIKNLTGETSSLSFSYDFVILNLFPV